MPNRSRSSTSSDTQSLRPNSFIRPNPAQLMSPSSDIVGPSPVTSNGTEIEDEATEETVQQANLDIAPQAQVSTHWDSTLRKLLTQGSSI